MSTVFPNKPYYTDASVEITISDCADDEESCEIHYELSYAANLKEFVLAFVDSTSLQDQVSTFCPTVNEVFTFFREAPREEHIACMLNGNHSFMVARSSSGGLTSEEKMAFVRVDEARKKELLSKLPEGAHCRVTLLVSALPKAFSNLVVSLRYKIRKDCHFHYWVADRPIFLKHFKIDASKLSLIDPSRISFHPLFANTTAYRDNDARLAVFSANLNNWVVKGQGIAVSWGPICQK